MDELKNQDCPVCHEKTATLIEDKRSFKNFKCFLFSITCSSCNYHKSDLEIEPSQKKKQSVSIKNSKELKVQLAKSSEALIKIPEIRLTIKPDISSNGYITTAEGILSKYKKELEEERDSAEDQEDRKKAKNQLKKLWKIELGEIPITLIIEDPSGNSALIT